MTSYKRNIFQKLKKLESKVIKIPCFEESNTFQITYKQGKNKANNDYETYLLSV